jgi:D-lactate dehydrogenase (cytochrome)
MANRYSGAELPDQPTVFLEFHANHGIDEEIAFCRELFDAHNVERFEIGDECEMIDLWQARRDLTYAILGYDPNLTPLRPGDVTVPIGSLGALIDYAKSLSRTESLHIPCFGHAGDGNLHYTVLVDTRDSDEVKRGEQIYSQIVQHAIALGGTATGEHGIGRGKREYLIQEHGATTVEAMRAIKHALDPHDTLNPGKLFPETVTGQRVTAPSTESAIYD